MSRGGGSWTRRSTLQPHVVAAQQRRGQELVARGGRKRKRGRAVIPANQPAGQARVKRDRKGARNE
jgi:hypothetical protein